MAPRDTWSSARQVLSSGTFWSAVGVLTSLAGGAWVYLDGFARDDDLTPIRASAEALGRGLRVLEERSFAAEQREREVRTREIDLWRRYVSLTAADAAEPRRRAEAAQRARMAYDEARREGLDPQAAAARALQDAQPPVRQR